MPVRHLVWGVIARTPPGLLRATPLLSVRRRALRLLNAALRRSPRDFEVVTPLGFRMAGNTLDVIQRHVYVFGVWEPDITAWVQQALRPGSVVIDVGANVGYFSLLAAEAAGPTGHVHAVEPLPSTLTRLRHNIGLNAPGRITVHAVACSDAEGRVEMFRASADNIGSSSSLGGEQSEGFVHCTTLDSLLADVDASTISLVKIDTEGDEVGVLLGAKRILHDMPRGAGVLVEVTPAMLSARGMAADDVVDLMDAHGFDAYTIDNDYHPGRYADRRTCEPEPLRGVPDKAQDLVFLKR